MDSYYSHNHYDWIRGWDDTNPNWYQVTVFDVEFERHNEIVAWMYDNIDNPERHARWVRLGDDSVFRFRYEKDFIWFRLTW